MQASVIAKNPRLYGMLPCPTTNGDTIPRAPEVAVYSQQHALYWRNLAVQRHGATCNADEWPPALFMQGGNRQRLGIPSVFIRYIDGGDNQKAGQGWNGFCKAIAPRDIVTDRAANVPIEGKGRRAIKSVP